MEMHVLNILKEFRDVNSLVFSRQSEVEIVLDGKGIS